MLVEIKNNVEEFEFKDLRGGDIFVYDNQVFIMLADEISDSDSRRRYNAVNLGTGEPIFFTEDVKIIDPYNYTFTVEL